MGDGILMRLGDGAHVYLRGRNALQFGLDATRAGIIETAHAPLIMATLLGARRVQPRAELIAGLTAAGLSAPAAGSLLDDLLAYRILVPRTERGVILIGRGRLAQLLSELLHGSGIDVRTPIRGESEYAYLAAADVSVPVVVADRLAHSKSMAPMLARFARTWVTVSVVDHRGLIGPLRIDGEGPCPLCADLHRTDRDPYWHRVVTQLPGGPVRPSPAVVSMVAAQAAAVIGALVGSPVPPGVVPLEVQPGEVVAADLWAGITREILIPHPRCPVCFIYALKDSRTASSCAP